jgi:hypothetical protein
LLGTAFFLLAVAERARALVLANAQRCGATISLAETSIPDSDLSADGFCWALSDVRACKAAVALVPEPAASAGSVSCHVFQACRSLVPISVPLAPGVTE